MLDDVADLLGVEAEVDGDEDASEDAHAEEAHQEAPGIGRDDGHALALTDPEIVQGGGEAPRHAGEPPVGDAAEPAPGRIRLVDDGHAVAVDLLGALEEIRQREGNVAPPLLAQPDGVSCWSR